MRQFKRLARKQDNQHRGVTLAELLIALCIFALIVIGFSSIDTFIRYHVVSSDRRAKLQNDASYVLGHMAKNIGQAIGGVNPAPVDTSSISGDTAIKVWVDYNQNGKRETYPPDRQIAYRFRGTTTGEIWYCPECTNDPCAACNPNWGSSENILSKEISSFTPTYTLGNNYVEIKITTRWKPNQSVSPANPEISMKNNISMPSISTH